MSVLLRSDCKRLGDIAAGTIVVHQPRTAPRIALDSVPPVVPVAPLAPEDQAALIALAARAPRLTGERLDELAALAAVVSAMPDGADPRSRGASSASRSGRWDAADDAAAVRSALSGEWTELKRSSIACSAAGANFRADEPVPGARVAVLYRRACEHSRWRGRGRIPRTSSIASSA